MWTYQNGQLIEQPSMERPICWGRYLGYNRDPAFFSDWELKASQDYDQHLKSLRTLPVSDELKKVLVEGGEYEENLHFKTTLQYFFNDEWSGSMYGSKGDISAWISCGEKTRLLAIPIEPQGIAMTGDFKKEVLIKALSEMVRTSPVFKQGNLLSSPVTLDEYLNALENAKKVLTTPDPTDKTEGWIDIKRSRWLPDYDRPVLWLQDNGNMFVDSLDKDGNPFLQHVTHWQNLPSPPEGTKIIKNQNTSNELR